ncbi:cytochrome P450 oxidoreductase [Rhodotorula diobovata]|uniref:Cytochrome P450 oxidoreductase n=1 Tax=Rhodotorula diobovata TaxID=5288 RepID=A0A5C5G3Q0_9BASI|nr:cytochrome P450 oxidoreductase [Rhodotorula diobovata]
MAPPARPAPPPALVEALRTARIPLESFDEACATCDSCEDPDAADYPKGFEMDLETVMLGSVQALGRQILVSTGKSDWIREVTEDGESIPGLVRAAYDETAAAGTPSEKKGLLGKIGGKLFGGDKKGEQEEGIPGVHPSSAAPLAEGAVSSKLCASDPSASGATDTHTMRLGSSILSSSFISSSHEGHRESVIVLPDYKVVHEVEASRAAADELVKSYLRPEAGRAGVGELSGSLRSWPLPYHCVILLCSHRKRDKRCSIAAPLLISQFHHHLEKHGFHGNAIIYFPNGTSVWYGRATPSDVGLIVDRTIMQGKVVPELLRGGMGLEGKDGERGVLDW